MSKHFIPLSPQEFSQLYGNDAVPDFILVSGDAYVDHPSFGPALIGRLLESEGYKIALIAQPDWRSVEDFAIFGRPRLGFLVTAGNLDSMVANYSAFKRPRRQDDYSPGGVAGKRPDRALIVYTGRIRQAFKGVTVVLGGIEASLRRLSHFDYWSDSIRRSVLLDAKADYLLYGMAEKGVVELARALAEKQIRRIDVPAHKIRGLVWALPGKEAHLDPKSNHITLSYDDTLTIPAYVLPSFEDLTADRQRYADHFSLQLSHADPVSGQTLVEPCGDRLVIQNPPAMPLSTEELDRIYELPCLRRQHPSYDNIGGVPALEEVRFSLVSSRGCFGGCSFCALTFHQGRIISARSHESLIREARLLIADPDFKGYIHDVGGPTANFRQPACSRQKNHGACPDRQCLFPSPCPNLQADHSDYLALLRKLRSLPGVKKVFIRSGIRYDYLLEDGNSEFMRELVAHHISGQLKVAPEHAGRKTLHAMGKPPISIYRRFSELFKKENEDLGKKQYLIPYLIAGHPGSDLAEAIELALFLKESGFIPDQVQDFYPTPGTVSTCMWATGIDPRDGKPVYVPKGEKERNLQRALLQFHKPENHPKVREALKKAGRTDLIGRGPGALVPPGRPGRQGQRR
jgi:uncharacterized radical SAM protein YgiQ